MLNWADYTILIIMLASMAYSVMRGFIREALSVLIWILAFWLALTYAMTLAHFLTTIIIHPMLRFAASFVLLFVLSLLVGGLISHFASYFVRSTGLSGTDRSLGLLFGFIRGALIIVTALFVVQMIYKTVPGWWHQSLLVNKFWMLIQLFQSMLPEAIRQHIQIPV